MEKLRKFSLLGSIMNDVPYKSKNVFTLIMAFYFQPSFRLLLNYRIGNYLINRGNISNLVASRLMFLQTKNWSCQISYHSKIGADFKIAHPVGVIIGNGVKIEDNVTIYQNVTVGSHGNNSKSQKYPIIKSNVTIYAQSTLIGNIIVENDAIIGANTLVNKSVSRCCIVYGNPAKYLKRKNENNQ